MNTLSRTVVDDVHTAAGKTLQEMCMLLETGISEYAKILGQVTSEAAKAGQTTVRYQEYASMISGLKGQLWRLGNMLNATTTNFITEIDTVDSYLY